MVDVRRRLAGGDPDIASLRSMAAALQPWQQLPESWGLVASALRCPPELEDYFDRVLGPIRSAAAELGRHHEQLLQVGAPLRNATAPGTFLGDWLVVTDVHASPGEKWDAICRLEDSWFRRPLHRARWRLALPHLRARAQSQGTTVEAELRAAVRQAIVLACDDVPPDTSLHDVLRATRAALANRLMDDLVGPGWRRRLSGTEVHGEVDSQYERELQPAYEAEVEALLQEFLRTLPELPERQRAALLARIEGRPLSNAEHQALHRLRRSPAFLRLARGAL